MDFGEYIGFHNLGNTCFMNSALQMLVHCQDLTTIMKRYNSRMPLAQSYYRLLHDYRKATRAIPPSAVKRAVGSEFATFRGFGQEDSHEFIINFLDMLEEEIKKDVPKHKKFISTLFDCQMEIVIKSRTSKQKSSKKEPVRFLQVPVHPGRKGQITLDSCFEGFVEPEELSDWEAPNGKKEKALKWTRITKFPRNLIFQLKRYSFSRGRRGQKIGTEVDVPLNWSPDATNDYILKGFVHQSGSLMGGHYTAYVRMNDDQWYHFNDSYVNRTSERQAMQVARHAYLLYYVRTSR